MDLLKLTGQELLINRLKNEFIKGYLPHSQLFVDSSGYGALPLVLSLCQSLIAHGNEAIATAVLEHPDVHFYYPTPSNTKSQKIDLPSLWRSFCYDNPFGSVYDWLRNIDSGNRQGSIRVEHISELQKQASLKPYAANLKIFVLWGVDLLLVPAANKLLKLLEEPPPHTYFLLVSEQTETLLPTLLSRCQQTVLDPLPDKILLKLYEQSFGEKASDVLLKMAQGSWRRLFELQIRKETHQELEVLWVAGLRLAFKARANRKIILPLFEWAQELANLNREAQKQFFLFGLDLIRDALMVNYEAASLHRFHSLTGFDLQKFAPYVHSHNIEELQHLLEKSHYHLGRNANARIVFVQFALELSRHLNRKESALLE